MREVHFIRTRDYLGQVKEAVQRIEMIEKRIEVFKEADLDIENLLYELESAKQALKCKKVNVTNMISRVSRPKYQWILMKRYVELLGWKDIAIQAKRNCHTVAQLHGFALPEMQDVLVKAGIIAQEDADDIKELLDEKGLLDVGTLQDYLKYREEKKLQGKTSARTTEVIELGV